MAILSLAFWTRPLRSWFVRKVKEATRQGARNLPSIESLEQRLTPASIPSLEDLLAESGTLFVPGSSSQTGTAAGDLGVFRDSVSPFSPGYFGGTLYAHSSFPNGPEGRFTLGDRLAGLGEVEIAGNQAPWVAGAFPQLARQGSHVIARWTAGQEGADYRLATRDLIVIDQRVLALTTPQQLAEAAAGADILIISSWVDGFQATTRQLRESSARYSSISVLGHGVEGAQSLGSGRLTADNAGQTAAWAPYLTPGADILLWGCQVGGGSQGARLLDALRAATGADIGASVDTTGSAGTAGDTDLEITRGDIGAATQGELAGVVSRLIGLNTLPDLDPAVPLTPSVNADGSQLTIPFSEALMTTGLPDISFFAVTSSGAPVPLSSYAVSGTSVVLTLGRKVSATEALLVTYGDPCCYNQDRPGLRDLAGNKVYNFTDRPVTTNGVDIVSPKLLTAQYTDAFYITLTFDEPLVIDGTPPASFTPALAGFSGLSTAGTPTVTVQGNRVTIVLGAAPPTSLTYTPPATNFLRDAAGNKVAGFTTGLAKSTGTAVGNIIFLNEPNDINDLLQFPAAGSNGSTSAPTGSTWATSDTGSQGIPLSRMISGQNPTTNTGLAITEYLPELQSPL